MTDSPNQGDIIVPKVTRAEWLAVMALALNFGTIAFVAGQVVQVQHEHSRRLDAEERRSEELVPKVERIYANVEYLTELAREQRMRNGK